MTHIIGVTGYRRSGKDSTCKILERFGYVRFAFADALRRMALGIDPLIHLDGAPSGVLDAVCKHPDNRGGLTTRYHVLVDAVGYEAAKEVPDFRLFLQRLGTEGVRNTFGPGAWVRALQQRIEQDAPPRISIADCRFLSEADWIHARGGMIIRVIRPGVGGTDLHQSETELDAIKADHIITADSLKALETKVLEIYADVLWAQEGRTLGN